MEKFDKRIVEYLIDKVTQHQRTMSGVHDVAINELLLAEDINDVMMAKKHLLRNVLYEFPIMDDTCYFCIYYREQVEEFHCKSCSYGKAHGKCGCRLFGGDEENTWRTMNIMKRKLQDFIEKNYWTGGEMKSGEHKRPKDI